MRKKNAIEEIELEFNEEIMEEKKMKKFNFKKIGLGIAGVTGLVIGGILLNKKGTKDADDEFDYDEDDELEEILDESEEILDEPENLHVRIF